MDVWFPGRTLENPGEQVLLLPKGAAADRAGPGPGIFAAKAEYAALDVHHPVMAVKGGKGYRLNQLDAFQSGRADRAGMGFSGPAFPGFPQP
jgi:hypothetical protein